jgi:hypothetical protein
MTSHARAALTALFAIPAFACAVASLPARADDPASPPDAGAAAAPAAGADAAPSRVSAFSGSVYVRRADAETAVAATVDAPVGAGDGLTTRAGGRAEITFPGGVLLRVATDTQVRFTRLDGESHMVQLVAGTVELRVLDNLAAHPEIDTPSATLLPDEAGSYRVTVTSDGATELTARSGHIEVIAQGGSQTLGPGSTLLVSGQGAAAQFKTVALEPDSDFDRWADSRDAQFIAAAPPAAAPDAPASAAPGAAPANVAPPPPPPAGAAPAAGAPPAADVPPPADAPPADVAPPSRGADQPPAADVAPAPSPASDAASQAGAAPPSYAGAVAPVGVPPVRGVAPVGQAYATDGMIPTAELNRYGSWTAVAGYGYVWIPAGQVAGWTPYRDGRRLWGPAPFHYGRWIYTRDRGWIWLPRHASPANRIPSYASPSYRTSPS